MKVLGAEDKSLRCEICTAPMQLVETVEGKRTKIKRYACTFCDFKKSIMSTGFSSIMPQEDKL